jgi:hypothetical protein
VAAQSDHQQPAAGHARRQMRVTGDGQRGHTLPQICDLAAIVRTCIDTQRLVWPRRTITLDEPAEAVHIRGDADRIGQVIIDYVTNALKRALTTGPGTFRGCATGTLCPILLCMADVIANHVAKGVLSGRLRTPYPHLSRTLREPQ